MNDSYRDIQMNMHRIEELDSVFSVLQEQKEKNSTAIRRLRSQEKNSVYLCGGSFFHKMSKEDAFKEIEEQNKRIEENIRENRSEYEIIVRKLHQYGIYGI